MTSVIVQCFVAFVSLSLTAAANDSVPVVMWHGMGDSCCNPVSLGRIKSIIEQHIPGVYVHSLQIGNNFVEDTENGFFMNVNKQVRMACEMIRNDSRLRHGYNAVGFSQGGQFLRAVAQRCPQPPMKNYVSIGGQHQGIFGLPHCPASAWICSTVRRLLDLGAYISWIQNSIVQAEYWHDPLDENLYKQRSVFLADINNERALNQTYKRNLLQLQKLLFIKFTRDSIVVPRGTEWFGFYRPGQAQQVIPMEETTLFTEDRIGLKQLKSAGKLKFLEVDGDHLEISEEKFVSEVIAKYLT